ncbi:MAG: DUF167 domain-containing protein [Candidatus Accumulibacter sp.]|jgi:uncharacterized protein (TIGR00251 family)|nr:DUF167 domain-containing protein [Accumulibacter sp.]
MTKSWYRESGETATLTLHVQPGAKRTEIAGLYGGALKVRLAAPPVDGKANDALIAFLAERLGVSKSAILLKSGQTSRDKRLEIAAPPPDARERLLTGIRDQESGIGGL